MHPGRLASRLTLALVSLIASITVIEFAGRALRLWHPDRAFRYHATRGYELTPAVGDVNSLGLRGPEVDPMSRPGVRRIVVLGDSFTYGDGVTAADALPAQLERRLNQSAATPVEVLNLGVPGYNTAQEYAAFQDVGLRLAPDVVVIAFTLSDADLGTFDTHSARPAALIRLKEFVKAHFGLYDFVRLQVRALQAWSFRNDPATAVWPEMYPLELATRGQPSPGWEQCQRALDGIAGECRRAGIPLLLVIWPVLERLTDYPYRAEHQFVTTRARSEGIPVVDLLPSFAGEDARQLRVSEQDPHPNPSAHRRAAHAVADFLRSSGLLRPPA